MIYLLHLGDVMWCDVDVMCYWTYHAPEGYMVVSEAGEDFLGKILHCFVERTVRATMCVGGRRGDVREGKLIWYIDRLDEQGAINEWSCSIDVMWYDGYHLSTCWSRVHTTLWCCVPIPAPPNDATDLEASDEQQAAYQHTAWRQGQPLHLNHSQSPDEKVGW